MNCNLWEAVEGKLTSSTSILPLKFLGSEVYNVGFDFDELVMYTRSKDYSNKQARKRRYRNT